MNNPLGFISATLKQTKPNFTDIIGHLQLYQELIENPGDEIQDHAEEIDLDYLLEDLPKTIDAMVMACDRLKNISTSLRTFSAQIKTIKYLLIFIKVLTVPFLFSNIVSKPMINAQQLKS